MSSYKELSKLVLHTIDNRRDHIIAFLQDLVRMPSPEGQGERIQEFIANYHSGLEADIVDKFSPNEEQLKDHPGFSPIEPEHGGCEIGDKPVVVGVYKGTGGGKSLIFTGHIASATGPWHLSEVERFKHDPFAGEIENGILYGRGSRNMKSGMAAAIMALKVIRESGVKLKGDVIIQTNTDEDTGCNGSMQTIVNGYKADGGICPEPTIAEKGFILYTAVGGACIFRIRVRGVAFSSSRHWMGVSALDKGFKIFKAIKEFEKHRVKTARKHPLFKDYKIFPTTVIGVFRSGNWPTTTPGQVIIEGRTGMVPGENPKDVMQEFESFVQSAAQSDSWLKDHPPIISWPWHWEPIEVPYDHPITQMTIEIFKEVMGEEPRIKGSPGAGDMCKFNAYGNTPTIYLGPITTGYLPETVHSYEENVVLDRYIDLTKMYALAILKWCSFE